MPLTCVTITGADDLTDPYNLVELYAGFPFVEYGILIGTNVRPRFPSVGWIRTLVEKRLEQDGPLMPLSLHVCGKYMRELEIGTSTLFDVLGPDLYSFNRIQLNCNGHHKSRIDAKNVMLAMFKLTESVPRIEWNPELIFQWRAVPDDFHSPSSFVFACAGLFDGSGDRGVSPGDWPDAPTDIRCGWAGGLGPHNLEAELPKIAAKAGLQDFWVDMESKVRNHDRSRLDLSAVEKCLEIAEPVVEAGILSRLL